MNFISLTTGITISLLLLDCALADYAQLKLYQKGNCKGWEHTANVENVCYYFPKLENEISGVKLARGSCGKVYRSRGCTGDFFLITHLNSNLCILPCCGWNDRIKAVTSCRSRRVSVSCPSGTYVREIEFGSADQGITFKCFHPTQSIAAYSKNTNGLAIPNPRTSKCNIAAFGMTAVYDGGFQLFRNPSLSCNRPSVSPRNVSSLELNYPTDMYNGTRATKRASSNQLGSCPGRFEALAGVIATVDEANAIKQLSTICRKVPDPSLLCEPVENLITVVSCDNRLSGNEFECTYSKTVGVGYSKSLTKTETLEYTFSQEVGFELGASTDGLAATISSKIGMSKLVGYQWSRQDTTTWTTEITASATIKVRPYAWSVLQQLTAKCSFFGVQVNFFRQVDMHPNGETTERLLRL